MTAITTVVVGLPEAGKTTFLAALWDAVNSNTCALRLVRMEPQREYLNRITSAWRKCEAVPRTTLATEHTVTLCVAIEQREAELIFPDHAGEKFLHQWTHREWDQSYAELVARADAVLLFINPDKHLPSPTIAQALPIIEGLDSGADHAGEMPAPWDPVSAPPDVQLTDLLQTILWYRNERPLPITVLISAWDAVEGLGLSPEDWLARHSPLLAQFLKASFSSGLIDIFGISAQGGDLVRDADHLLGCDRPSDRVRVRHQNDVHQDITRPILSLLGDAREE